MKITDRHIAGIIGTGLVLIAIHNPYQPLLDYAFLPQVGLMLIIMGCVVILVNRYREITLGKKYIWIPLLAIIISIGISQPGAILMGGTLFILYLVSRILGKQILLPF